MVFPKKIVLDNVICNQDNLRVNYSLGFKHTPLLLFGFNIHRFQKIGNRMLQEYFKYLKLVLPGGSLGFQFKELNISVSEISDG